MELTLENNAKRTDMGNMSRGDATVLADDESTQMSHLSKMAALDIEFHDLMYSAPGYKNGKLLLVVVAFMNT